MDNQQTNEQNIGLDENGFDLLNEISQVKESIIQKAAQMILIRFDAIATKKLKGKIGEDIMANLRKSFMNRILVVMDDMLNELLSAEDMQMQLDQAYNLNSKVDQCYEVCYTCELIEKPKCDALEKMRTLGESIKETCEEESNKVDKYEQEDLDLSDQFIQLLKKTYRSCDRLCEKLIFLRLPVPFIE